jgi:hypothetical protein
MRKRSANLKWKQRVAHAPFEWSTHALHQAGDDDSVHEEGMNLLKKAGLMTVNVTIPDAENGIFASLCGPHTQEPSGCTTFVDVKIDRGMY